MKTIVPTNSPDQEALVHIRSVLPERTLQGVYICFEFPPITSPAASCVSRRLAELPQLLDRHIEWEIITPEKSYSYLPVNNQRFADLFASKLYKELIRIGDYDVWGDSFDDRWFVGMTDTINQISRNHSIDLICTRSMPALVHKVAMSFAQGFPIEDRPVWVAEFSDVFTQDVNNEYIGDNPCFDMTIAEFEEAVYRNADMVVQTNINQKNLTIENMKRRLNNDEQIRLFEKKTAVMNHPILARKWCNAVQSPYVATINRNKINVAYFGVWMYKQRTTGLLQELANYPDFELHFFMPGQYHAGYIMDAGGCDNIRRNEPVDTLEMLNIADNMDYLYVEDSAYPGRVNPYLPSKLSDYLSTNTLIIARVQHGSAIDLMNNERIIKLYSEDKITDGFVDELILATGKRRLF
jgi:hypothetical protein